MDMDTYSDRIREQNWYGLVYDNTNIDAFYCFELVKKFCLGIDITTIYLDHNQSLVHFDHGGLLATPTTIEEVTQIPVSLMQDAPLPLIDYILFVMPHFPKYMETES